LIGIAGQKQRSIVAWLAFALLLAFYIAAYAPYGIENNDTGFIMGLAHQVFLKESLYDHVIYVRPPVSLILHSLFFHEPFASAPIFFDRCFFFLQIAIYSGLSALVARRLFAWGGATTAIAATLTFIFSAHNFPPMAWHTVDGIFFAAIAFYFLFLGAGKVSPFLFVAALAAWLSAGAKQPFYLTPVVLLALSWLIDARRRTFHTFGASLLVSALVLAALFPIFGSGSQLLRAVSAQTTLQDLLSAGLLNYINDLTRPRSLIGAWPFLVALLYGVVKPDQPARHAWALFASIGLLLLVATQYYRTMDAWGAPYFLFDSIFVITAIYCLIMLIKTGEQAWWWLIGMHAIAWASSISWGYQTPILYAAPSVLTLTCFINKAVEHSKGLRLAITLLLPASVGLFYLGHRYYFSGEAVVPRADLTVDMQPISPALSRIKGTPQQFQIYSELVELIRHRPGRPFAVLPNMPLAHALVGQPNPIGIDWPINAEVGPFLPMIQSKLAQSVDYAIVVRHVQPPPATDGKFGCKAALYVMAHWQLVGTTPHFDIYENPSRKGLSSQGTAATDVVAISPKVE
jgi:hypothetical protein